HDFADLYDLNVPTLAELERLAKKSATNLFEAIAHSRERGLARLLFGLGIRHVGERGAAVLARRYRTITALAAASAEELAATHEIGPVIAESLFHFFAKEKNQKIPPLFRVVGVAMEETPPATSGPPSPQVLAGKVFVPPGPLPPLPRKKAQAFTTA